MAVVTALIRGSFGYPWRTRDSLCYPVRWKQLTDTIVGYIYRVSFGALGLSVLEINSIKRINLNRLLIKSREIN